MLGKVKHGTDFVGFTMFLKMIPLDLELNVVTTGPSMARTNS